jgi:membrane-associated protease RseP (regulator of RpoE activity)
MKAKTIPILGLLVLAAAFLLPQPGQTQERTVWTYQASPRGWIGVTVSFDIIVENGVERSRVTVSDVIEGGPASRAGVQVGDVLTMIDGQPVTQRYFTTMPNTLNPGDLVELVLHRDGEPIEISVEAAERENAFTLHEPDIEQMVITLDTIRGAIYKDLESLTVTIAGLRREQGQGATGVELARLPPKSPEFAEGTIFTLREAADSLARHWNAFVVDPGFSVSFRGFLMDSPETDSLYQALQVARRDLTRVRRQEESRERQIRASIQGNAEEYLANDERLQDLKAEEAELVTAQEEMALKLSRVQEELMQREWAEVRAQSNQAFAEAQAERARAASRWADQAAAERDRQAEVVWRRSLEGYRSPILVGQDFILGADIKPLTPEIAEITSAREGVVVYAVPPGTPAAKVGLKGLDVIIQVGGETIHSIGDLRRTLELFEGPVRLTVVRLGETDPVEILIRR